MRIIVDDGTGKECVSVEWNDDGNSCRVSLAVGGTLQTSPECLRKLWECLDVLYASPRPKSGTLRSTGMRVHHGP